jgi:hypothetical protein
MKKVYLLVSAVSIGSLAFGQQTLIRNAQRQEAQQILSQSENSIEKAPVHAFTKAPGDVLFSDNFASGIGAWTTAGANGSVWAVDLNGPNGQYSQATEKIQSTTQANGFAMFDADLNNPGAGPYTSYVASLVSPVVDMTGITNALLSFEHRYRTCCDNTFYPKVEVSTDGFVTSTEFDVTVPGVVVNATSATTKAKVNLTTFLATATNLSNFQFRFTWDGAAGTTHYHWQIDDVSLIEANDNDITSLNRVMVSGVNEIPYYSIPVNQISPITFSGEVRNDGGTTQTNVMLTVAANNSGGTVASPTATLVAGATDSLVTALWTPPATVPTNYALTYTFSQTQTDATPTDNASADAIAITRSLYAVDNNVPSSFISNLSSQANQALKIGNVMEVMADDIIDSMYIGVTTTATNVGQEIFGEVWRDNGTDWEYLGTTPYFAITTQTNGTSIKLPMENIINVTAGDLLLVVACHTGGATADVRFRTAQPVEEGIVQGFAADGTGFFLASPNAVMVRLNIQPTADINENAAAVSISNVFPNPTTGLTSINYNLANATDVTIEVVDIAGKVVYTANNGTQLAGGHTVSFDAASFTQGVYYVTVSTNETVVTKKFIKK